MSNRYVQPLRLLIQCCYLALSVIIGLRFYLFSLAVQHGMATSTRPAAIDAFLPISGLFGTVAWLKGGGINPLHPAAVVVFILAIAVSLLLRRAFCSWICPIGTLSEWLWKLGFHRLQRNWLPPRQLDLALRSIKYLAMSFFLYTAFSWSLAMLQQFLGSDYHAISDFKLLALFRAPSITTLAVIGLLLLFSLPLRNPFCRYLCPYGALLGLVSFWSPTAVQRDGKKCISCGVCNQVCPSRLDIMHTQRVTSPECIGCWRCISHCRVHTALSMRAFGRLLISGLVFALLVILLFWGGTGLGKRSGHWQGVLTSQDYRHLLGH